MGNLYGYSWGEPDDDAPSALDTLLDDEAADADLADAIMYQVCPGCGADLTDPANGAGGWHICDAGPDNSDEMPF